MYANTEVKSKEWTLLWPQITMKEKKVTCISVIHGKRKQVHETSECLLSLMLQQPTTGPSAYVGSHPICSVVESVIYYTLVCWGAVNQNTTRLNKHTEEVRSANGGGRWMAFKWTSTSSMVYCWMEYLQQEPDPVRIHQEYYRKPILKSELGLCWPVFKLQHGE